MFESVAVREENAKIQVGVVFFIWRFFFWLQKV